MLSELRVAGIGIIDDLTLGLGPGLTVVTGETGAGKTLLVEALELLLGARADAGLVRAGSGVARVEGRFVTDGGSDGDDELVVGRVVPAEGRSRAYVNGRLAAAGELGDLGAALVDLHGQHAHQSLLAPAVQRRALDRFAGEPVATRLVEYRRHRDSARDAERELAALGGDDRARARELDLLRHQIDEIADAGLVDAHEDTVLEGEEDLLADADAHRAALADAQQALEGGAADGLGVAAGALTGRSPFAGLADRMLVAQAEVAELARELRHAGEATVVDPARLDAVRDRRRLLRELMRKYGEDLAAVIEFGRSAVTRAEELDRHEARADELDEARRDHEAAATCAASALSAARREAAPELGDAVASHLHALAMPAARVTTLVEPDTPGDDGADAVTFLLAANAGEPLRPLARAASGGELVRAMLALRVVLSEAAPTLVFDEVDAGIGGEAATAVGRLLARLAREHQVLCVTHLAQVAAFADHHLVVAKHQERHQEGNRTVATATPVTGPARLEELARMLAGMRESSGARRTARELLDQTRRERDGEPVGGAQAGRR